MAATDDARDRALREWLTQVLSGHGFQPATSGCQCGWTDGRPTQDGDQQPWLAHRTDVILDVLELTHSAQSDDSAEWERLAAKMRTIDPH